MKIILILITFLLTSCGFESALFRIKTAADGISYVTTKKNTNDNIVSVVTNKNCDTLNILEKKPYCRVKVVYNPPARNGLKVIWAKL